MFRSFIDRCWRTALVLAYGGLRAYWFAVRPRTRGVYVAVWVQGNLLVIRNSYRPRLSLPGGAVDRGEEVASAAARELREEVGIEVEAGALRFARSYIVNEDYHEDRASFFEIELENEPDIAIDRREVVWAEFRALAGMKRAELVTPLRLYLEDRPE